MKTSFFTSDGSKLIADLPRPSKALESRLLNLKNKADSMLAGFVLFSEQAKVCDKQDVLRSLDVVLECFKGEVSERTSIKFDFYDRKNGLKLLNISNMSGFLFDGRAASLNCDRMPGECLVVWIGREYFNVPIEMRSRQIPGVGVLVDDNGKEVAFKNRNEASDFRDIVLSLRSHLVAAGTDRILVTGA